MVSQASNNEFSPLGVSLGDTAPELPSMAPGQPLDPDAAKGYVRYLHDHPLIKIDDEEIDFLLYGIRHAESERVLKETVNLHDIGERYGKEVTWFPGGPGVWTPYSTVRALVHALELGEHDVVYDLGAGYGRIALYAGITSAATCKGIELFSERVKIARQAQERLALDNVEFIEGNVREQDYSEGDVFYTFIPFSHDTFNEVTGQLESIAKEKRIRIVTRGGQERFEREGWLRKLGEVSAAIVPPYTSKTTIFESR